MTPSVSVVLLSYNQAAYLPQAVESVFRQTTSDWQLIVIDNGSTDDSARILESWANDPRVTLILHQKNDAPTKRLNEGVKRSTGRFISLLYSDDMYLPNKLERQLALFDAHPDCGVVYSPGYRLNETTGARWLDPSTSASGMALDGLLDDLERRAYINPIAPLARRECFERYPFHEELFIEGEASYLRYALGFRFFFDAEPTVVMRDHGSNTGRSVKRNIDYFLFSLDQLERHREFPAGSRHRLHDLRVRVFRNAGWQGVRVVGDMPWARQMFGRTVKAQRSQLFHPKVMFGTVMSYLPSRVLTLANALGNTARRSSGHRNYVEPTA